MKHAFLIMAHSEPEIFRLLIERLDHPHNHIFVHVDAKVDVAPFKQAAVKLLHSNATFIPRKRLRWGHASLTDCMLRLFEEASKSGPFDWYHLLSGQCLPLKSNDEINRFYASHSQYDAMMEIETAQDPDLLYRLQLYHLRAPQLARRIIFKAQRICGVNRLTAWRKNFDHIYYGSQWFDLNDMAVSYLLSHKADILPLIHHTHCSDEMAIQTVIGNSPLHIYPGNLRYIDWSARLPSPRTLTLADLPALRSTTCLFARKFDSHLSRELISQLYSMPLPQ